MGWIIGRVVSVVFRLVGLLLAPLFLIGMLLKQVLWDIPMAYAMRGLGELNVLLFTGRKRDASP